MYFMPGISPIVRDPSPIPALERSAARQARAPETALVAFDRSAAARCALDYAIAWARTRRGRIHLVNVQSMPRDEAVFHESSLEAGERILAGARAHLDEANVAHSSEVCFGPVASAIVECAVRTGCRPIMIGARSRAAWRSFFSASVSSEVVRLSPVEVAVVTHRVTSLVHAPWSASRRRNAA
jgi:nucleotide-binding universal stress UspA family protein